MHGFCDQSPEALAGISTLRGLAGTLHYALPDLGTGQQRELGRHRLPGAGRPPAGTPLNARSACVAATGSDETVEADVCIVGSGAGGGVIAGELAAAGQVRSWCSRPATTTTTRTSTASNCPPTSASYLNGGPFPTAEGQVSIVAGTGVGGGTVVNWTNCLRTTDHVRAEWACEHGLSDLAEASFDAPPRRGVRAPPGERGLQRPERLP